MPRYRGWRRWPHLLVSRVQLFELFPPALRQPRALRGTHEAPLPVLLHPLHEQVRNPQTVEKIPDRDKKKYNNEGPGVSEKKKEKRSHTRHQVGIENKNKNTIRRSDETSQRVGIFVRTLKTQFFFHVCFTWF